MIVTIQKTYSATLLHGRCYNSAAVTLQMCITPSEQCAQNVRMTQQHFDFRFAPIFGWNLLHELKEFVEIHLLELATKLGQKSGTNVNVKVLETISALLADICIP